MARGYIFWLYLGYCKIADEDLRQLVALVVVVVGILVTITAASGSDRLSEHGVSRSLSTLGDL